MKPITDVMREYRRGELVQNATHEMAAVVAAVVALRKPGSVTITLEIRPDKHSAKEVEVQASVSSKLPKRGMKAGTFFVGRDNELLRNDPDQIDAFDPDTGEVQNEPLRAVPAPRDGTDG